MKTFVINTVGQTNQLGIFDGSKNIAEYLSDESTKRSGSENLLEKSQELLKKADLKVSDIELIIVVMGPGSYTGSRAGLAFAKAFSHASEIPITGVSMFDVAVYKKTDSTYPMTELFQAGGDRHYAKDYTASKDIFTTREKGEVIEGSVKNENTNLDDMATITLQNINDYGIEYFKQNATDDYAKLLPLYLKEPNITLPKKK